MGPSQRGLDIVMKTVKESLNTAAVKDLEEPTCPQTSTTSACISEGGQTPLWLG